MVMCVLCDHFPRGIRTFHSSLPSTSFPILCNMHQPPTIMHLFHLPPHTTTTTTTTTISSIYHTSTSTPTTIHCLYQPHHTPPNTSSPSARHPTPPSLLPFLIPLTSPSLSPPLDPLLPHPSSSPSPMMPPFLSPLHHSLYPSLATAFLVSPSSRCFSPPPSISLSLFI
ncbi:hypothetical protein CsSME_00023031 [Camellia sinensis var. sinensis]